MSNPRLWISHNTGALIAAGLFLILYVFYSSLHPRGFTSDLFVQNSNEALALIFVSMAQTMVVLLGGIDLSVGSLMGVVGVVCGVLLEGGYPWWVALVGGLGAGVVAGAINGALVAYAGLSPFVVTLGMLSFARSIAIVLSENRMIYDFGPDGAAFKVIGGGRFPPDSWNMPFQLANPVWVLIILTIVFSIILKYTTWGRHLYAIGGNEHAARLTGVPVDRIKMQAYMVSGLTAAISAVLIVGWQGSAINALGTSYELRVIASTVIGGANLMGGEGGPIGAVVGAALLEVIRNSLLMQGIDANWQGAFVGVFIILAVLLEKIRGRRRA